LCDGGEGEFELGAARTSQTQSDEAQDALEVGEQHLDLFAIVTRLRIGPCFSECAGNIACLLIDVTIDPPRGRFWATTQL
jgi:hypothetical protein